MTDQTIISLPIALMMLSPLLVLAFAMFALLGIADRMHQAVEEVETQRQREDAAARAAFGPGASRHLIARCDKVGTVDGLRQEIEATIGRVAPFQSALFAPRVEIIESVNQVQVIIKRLFFRSRKTIEAIQTAANRQKPWPCRLEIAFR